MTTTTTTAVPTPAPITPASAPTTTASGPVHTPLSHTLPSEAGGNNSAIELSPGNIRVVQSDHSSSDDLLSRPDFIRYMDAMHTGRSLALVNACTSPVKESLHSLLLQAGMAISGSALLFFDHFKRPFSDIVIWSVIGESGRSS